MTEEQKIAATWSQGPLLVLAGPGTGKTRTLIARIEHLIASGVNPRRLLCTTFSKRAADEIKERLRSSMSPAAANVDIGTFHATALGIVRSIGSHVGIAPDFDLWVKDSERRKLVEELIKETKDDDPSLHLPRDDDEEFITRALEFIDGMREAMIDPDDASLRAFERNDAEALALSEIYARFDHALQQQEKIDFPRLMQLACAALKADAETDGIGHRKYDHLLIDEYQDINLAQKTLVDHFVRGGATVWAVGDDKQAIYGWRGSDVSYLQNFATHYPGARTVQLSWNFRSGKKIVALANNLAEHFETSLGARLVPNRTHDGETDRICLVSDVEETSYVVDQVQRLLAAGTPPTEIAILARINRRLERVANALLLAGIPAELKGGARAFRSYEARAILNAAAILIAAPLPRGLRLKLPVDLYGFAKDKAGSPWVPTVKALGTFLANRAPRHLSQDAIEERRARIAEIVERLQSFDDPPRYFDAMSRMEAAPDDRRVFVGTIHSAKGLEWDAVIALGWEEGVLPIDRKGTLTNMEEERRLAYVATTRARHTFIQTIVDPDGEMESAREVSRFIGEMWEVPKGRATSQDTEVVETRIAPSRSGEVARDLEVPKTLSPREERLRRIIEKIAREKETRAEREASAWGEGADTGWLHLAGYSVAQNGPSRSARHRVLSAIYTGEKRLPHQLSDSVRKQWGEPHSPERLSKLTSTIKTAMAAMQGRRRPSEQAIRKWTEDLDYIERVLSGPKS
jgi:DNA helicase-2/ATP-dependent DNA helicase PcrA